MGLQMHVSFILSAALGLAWSRRPDGISKQVADQVSAQIPSLVKALARTAAVLKSGDTYLPAALALAAASDPKLFFYSAWPLGFILAGQRPPTLDWFGEGGSWRHWALIASLSLWRAEKIENLVQRVQRSATYVRECGGVGHVWGSVCRDPYGWLWPPFWGIVRRFALVAVSSFGCEPFARVAFPAVVVDELLQTALAKGEEVWTSRVRAPPAVVSNLVLPVLSVGHFVPVIWQVGLLAFVEYPVYNHPSGDASCLPAVLALAAFCWTLHNLHTTYVTVFRDVPDSARQL